MISTPLADLKPSDVHRVGNEDHGKSAVIFILCFKCILLLSFGHPAVALWGLPAASTKALWEFLAGKPETFR